VSSSDAAMPGKQNNGGEFEWVRWQRLSGIVANDSTISPFNLTRRFYRIILRNKPEEPNKCDFSASKLEVPVFEHEITKCSLDKMQITKSIGCNAHKITT
jgi:hypothetical protein